MVIGWVSGRDAAPFSAEPTLSRFFSSAPGSSLPAGGATEARRASDKGITTPGKLVWSFLVNGFTQKGIVAVSLRGTNDHGLFFYRRIGALAFFVVYLLCVWRERTVSGGNLGRPCVGARSTSVRSNLGQSAGSLLKDGSVAQGLEVAMADIGLMKEGLGACRTSGHALSLRVSVTEAGAETRQRLFFNASRVEMARDGWYIGMWRVYSNQDKDGENRLSMAQWIGQRGIWQRGRGSVRPRDCRSPS